MPLSSLRVLTFLFFSYLTTNAVEPYTQGGLTLSPMGYRWNIQRHTLIL